MEISLTFGSVPDFVLPKFFGVGEVFPFSFHAWPILLAAGVCMAVASKSEESDIFRC